MKDLHRDVRLDVGLAEERENWVRQPPVGQELAQVRLLSVQAVPFYAFTRKLVGLVPEKGVRSDAGPLSAAARTSRAGPRRARPASR
jgi:hypothetical protein